MKFHLQHVYSFSSSPPPHPSLLALILQVYITLPTRVGSAASLVLLSPLESQPEAPAPVWPPFPNTAASLKEVVETWPPHLVLTPAVVAISSFIQYGFLDKQMDFPLLTLHKYYFKGAFEIAQTITCFPPSHNIFTVLHYADGVFSPCLS